MAVIDQPFTERLRLMTSGQTDLHCGGANTNLPLPAYLRRERFLDLTAGIVAREGQPPLECKPVVRELSYYLWIDYDSPASAAQAATPPDAGSSSLGRLLERLYRQTDRRVTAILRAGNPGMFLTAAGPWLSRLPLELLDRLDVRRLKPRATRFGRRRCRTSFDARRSAEHLALFRLLERTVRDIALARNRRPRG